MQSTERRSPGPASRRCFIQSSSPLEAAREAPSRRDGIVPLSTRSSRTCLSFSVSIWTTEAFVLECHELVGFDQSLSVFSRTRPGCAYRDRRRTELSSAAFARVCRGSASRLGQLSRKVRLIAPDACLRRVACVLACKCPGRGFTQCAAANAVHIALVMAPIGLPLGAPK